MLVRFLEVATEYLIIHSPHPFPSSCTIFGLLGKESIIDEQMIGCYIECNIS